MKKRVLFLYTLLFGYVLLGSYQNEYFLSKLSRLENHHSDLKDKLSVYETMEDRFNCLSYDVDNLATSTFSLFNEIVLLDENLSFKLKVKPSQINLKPLLDTLEKIEPIDVPIPKPQPISKEGEEAISTDDPNETSNSEIELFYEITEVLGSRRKKAVNSIKETSVYIVMNSQFSTNKRFIKKVKINNQWVPIKNISEEVVRSKGGKVKIAEELKYFIEVEVKKGILNVGNNEVIVEADGKYFKTFNIDLKGMKSVKKNRPVVFIKISDIYDIYDKNWLEADIKLNTEFLWVSLDSKYSDLSKDYINKISINKVEVEILDFVKKESNLIMRKQVFSYHIKLNIEKNNILPGVNNIIIKAGEIEYFQAFIAH